MATTQDQRTLQLSTPLAKDFLLINRLHCSEGLNQLFRIELEMLHEENNEGFEPTVIDPKSLLGNPMVVVALQVQTSELTVERYFHGICVNFTQGSRNARFSKYRAELVPAVWLLTQRSQSRIFQNKSIPEILREVLEGIEYDDEIQGPFEPRNYCVQYHETDWDFASRLMEEEGIYYYFEHTAAGHRLILANTAASHRPCPKLSTVPFALERPELKDDWIPAIHSWQVDNKMRTGKYELRDFNFQLPASSLLAEHNSLFKVGGNNQLLVYDWPGEYAQRFDGIDQGGSEQPAELKKVFIDRERTVQIRQEEIDVAYKNVYGTADCCTLTAGYKFELTKHPIKENNIGHVLVSVQHEAAQSPSYISRGGLPNAYIVNFVCIPHGNGHAPFRPLRKTIKPVVQGSQTAFVVGPPGEEIFTDKYGRVKVHFHWDRSDDLDHRSSCWLRVAQMWSGRGWGTMFIPRIGMEVMINFLEGDPDQPIIAGCVYNPINMPPYNLADHKTRSTIKSHSSMGGGGFNEFRFEDKKGKEQIFIHAERNEDIRVKNECMETIGSNRHLNVGGDQLEKVYGDKHLKVAGDRYEMVEGDTSLIVSGDYDMRSTATNFEATVIHLKGKKIVIDAENELSLKSGSGFISIKKDGTVTISGMKVLINSGGSVGSAADCSPTVPKSPKEADNADGGKTIEPSSAPPPPPSPQLAKLTVAAKKVRKKKDQGGSKAGNSITKATQEAMLLLEDVKAKMKERDKRVMEAAKDVAAKVARTVIAATDGLPFINDTEPAPPGKTPKSDEDYYKLAEETGKPVTSPDGTTYEIHPVGRSKSKPMTDEDFFEIAEQTGKPVKAPDGTTYEIHPVGRSKSKPMTPEQIIQANEEYKRRKEES